MRAILAGLLFVVSLSAADLTGIWMGEVPGRFGEKLDIAFQFEMKKGTITGVMFGDDFDLPVEELRVEGSQITFSVTSINYNDKRRTKTVYTGSLADKTLELTREQITNNPATTAVKPKDPPVKITLKRLS